MRTFFLISLVVSFCAGPQSGVFSSGDVPPCDPDVPVGHELIEATVGGELCRAPVAEAYESAIATASSTMIITASFEHDSEDFAAIEWELVVPNAVGAYTCPPLQDLQPHDPQVTVFIALNNDLAGGRTHTDQGSCEVEVLSAAPEIGDVFEGTFSAQVARVHAGQLVQTDVEEGSFRAVRGSHPSF